MDPARHPRPAHRPPPLVRLRASLPRLGSNLLAERLRVLEEAGLVARRRLPPPAARTVYELTDRGRELDAVVLSLARFGLPDLDAPTEEQPLLPHLRDEALRAMVRFEAMPGPGLRSASSSTRVATG